MAYLRLLLLGLLLCLSAACGPPARATGAPSVATSAPLLLPTVTPTPVHAAAPSLALTTTLTNTVLGLTLTLPAGWQPVTPTLASLLRGVTLIDPLSTTLPLTTTTLASLTLVAAATTTDAATPAHFGLAVMPWPASAPAAPLDLLTAAAYLNGFTAQLPGTVVAPPRPAPTLRADFLPVVATEYTLTLTLQAAPTTITGYQVLLLDLSTQRLYLFDFAAPPAAFAALRPDFAAIVRGVRFAP